MRFLEMARLVSSWSKDPSTKCGAVIADPDRRVVSVGFNGFPRGCDDAAELYEHRGRKYRRVVHAEVNAVLFAAKPVCGCTLYTVPFQPCAPCAAVMVQAGVRRVVAPHPSEDVLSRWADDIREAQAVFAEAGVELELVEVAR